MATAKIAITMNAETIKKLDRLVGKKVFPNRSKAIQEAVEEKISRMDKNRLARECAKLDPKLEQILAEEGFHMETSEWPEY
jgi:metal-responsive CopG/Arc/MetJ family transcriptional regulator